MCCISSFLYDLPRMSLLCTAIEGRQKDWKKVDWIIRLGFFYIEQLSTWREAGTAWWERVRLAFLGSYFHYHSLSLSGETNFKTSWSICSVKIGPLDIFRLADSTLHHLWPDLGKSVGLVGFGIKQALRFFFLRGVWGWLSSFAELYWTWLSFHKENGVMNVWGLVMLNFLSSW